MNRRPSSRARSAKGFSRRAFMQTAGATSVAVAIGARFLGPTILGAQDKAGAKAPVLGEGAFQYEIVSHSWGEVPKHIVWGETHGVCVDEAGLVYIKHRSNAKVPLDAIAVFDPQGKFVRSFGKEYHTGGHGIDVRKEGNEEFLYLCDVSHGVVAKTNLKGEVVLRKERPTETGLYDDPKKRYSPTNVCFAPNGGFYIGDGYGSHYIHQYDKDAKYVRSWGGEGVEPGKMKTPHGLWLDNRPGRDPTLVVADRANARLQYFSLDGKFLSLLNDTVSFPAHFDIRGDVLLVPDLHARVTLLDIHNKVIAHLGYEAEWTKKVLGDGKFAVRRDPKQWVHGKWIHPHDACYDKDGNIFVVEWVPTGRVTLMRHVG